MPVRNRAGALTAEERSIVKALLAQKRRNQDIQDLLNYGRKVTINGGRITEVKKQSIKAATDDEVKFFIARKNAWDPKTGLNRYDDERLLRAREAICLAVHVFNSPTMLFKTEVFAVLANVAWTYLLQEYYSRRNIKIADEKGRTFELSKLLALPQCPLSAGVKSNLQDLKQIRDAVEHKLLGRSDANWLPLFQACCLNFDRTLCEHFGDKLSLTHDLSFALQFAKLNIDQIAILQKYEIPEHIQALDARLQADKTEEQLNDLEYRFRVIYTLDSASKSQAHINFVNPGSEEGRDIRNVLVKHSRTDRLYPHKAGKVWKLVKERSGKTFSSHNHTQAWRKFEVRPRDTSTKPEETKEQYCIYHSAHGDYTYSDAWVDFLVEKISTDEGFDEIRNFKLK